ncbi:MAG: hypothetical protein IPO07_20765 [Haliscomenobacter sp.]|nr:hypothetical protein [Haliscomenobacter sp.]
MITFKNELYFKTQDGINGLELWKSDGSANGTKIFTKLNSAGASSFPYQIKVVKDFDVFRKTETTGLNCGNRMAPQRVLNW